MKKVIIAAAMLLSSNVFAADDCIKSVWSLVDAKVLQHKAAVPCESAILGGEGIFHESCRVWVSLAQSADKAVDVSRAACSAEEFKSNLSDVVNKVITTEEDVNRVDSNEFVREFIKATLNVLKDK